MIQIHNKVRRQVEGLYSIFFYMFFLKTFIFLACISILIDAGYFILLNRNRSLFIEVSIMTNIESTYVF
jgi:hypothetical protein